MLVHCNQFTYPRLQKCYSILAPIFDVRVRVIFRRGSGSDPMLFPKSNVKSIIITYRDSKRTITHSQNLEKLHFMKLLLKCLAQNEINLNSAFLIVDSCALNLIYYK